MTWQPAFSKRRAMIMLFSSSKRAFTSISTVTCLPSSAAFTKEATIGESPLTRYKVCLIANTSGSKAARAMNSSTMEKESKG